MSDVLPSDGVLFHTKKGKPIAMPVSLAPLADTHGHLTSFRTLDAVGAIARAAFAGVRLLVVPVDPSDDVRDVPTFTSWFARTVEEARQMIAVAADCGWTPPTFDDWPDVAPLVDRVRFVAGVHPYGAQRYVDDATVRGRLRALLADERCVGVGEFGLDYGPWNEIDPEVQARSMRMQLRIAHELGLPVELHIRDANDDVTAQAHEDALHILREEGVPEAGCDLHCFTSGPEVLVPFAELGCHVAFGGAVTFARSEEIRAAAGACPGDLLLSETDSPYMAPTPLRGMECEPAMVAFSAACVAQVREELGLATARQTYAALWHNACAFFGLD